MILSILKSYMHT